jgi:hypothetical protein
VDTARPAERRADPRCCLAGIVAIAGR